MIVAEFSFSTEPHLLEQRLALRPAHREQLADHLANGRIVFSGPLTDGTGAIIGVDGDFAAFESLVAADPYWTSAGTKLVQAREIDAVFCRPHVQA